MICVAATTATIRVCPIARSSRLTVNISLSDIVYEVAPRSVPPPYDDDDPQRADEPDDITSAEGVFITVGGDSSLTLEDYAMMRDGLWCCLLCDYRNPRTRLIKRHLSSNHAGLRPFRCGCCHKTYVDKSGLVRHQLMAHREKPIRCPHCPARFSLPWLCRQHAKRVHPHEPDL